MTAPPSPATDCAELTAALVGQYEIEREVGRGGMGIVYLAHDVKLQRRVAIKTLPPHLVGDPHIRERFLREARTAGGLSHQNIVPIHRADELGGQVFFVMGFVDGESMAQRLKERGRLDPREVVRELRDVAMALGYAHAHGVIHRDVKAENVLIERASGRALVTDFGIARLAEATPLTSTGQVLGSVYYLSPEQVSGEPADARSDIYSLGVVGYVALAGRFPFDGEVASAVLVSHVTKMAPPLRTIAPDVPRVFAEIIDRCLSKDPASRFQNCIELGDALAGIESHIDAEVGAWSGSRPSNKPTLLSDTEAQAIWKRAADLQASTGTQPRPEAIPSPRDVEKDAARTSGYPLADVRDAAVEAGISNRYVEHALVERGLSDVHPPPVEPRMLVDHVISESSFYGGPVRIDFEIVVDGEMSEDDFVLLAEIIRRRTRDAGQVATVGPAFSWQALPMKRSLQVVVLPRAGKTTIRVSEDLQPLTNSIFALATMGTTFLSMMASAIGMKNGLSLAALMMGGTIALGYLVARGIYGRSSRARVVEARTLAEALAAQARGSIAAAELQARAADDATTWRLT